jgi:hypothetical protein
MTVFGRRGARGTIPGAAILVKPLEDRQVTTRRRNSATIWIPRTVQYQP